MNRVGAGQAISVTIALALASFGVWLAFSVLMALGQATDESARVARVQRMDAEAQKMRHRVVSVAHYPSNALCHGPTRDHLGPIEASLHRMADTRQLKAQMQLKAEDGPTDGFEPIHLDLSAEAGEDSIEGFLASLADVRPSLFVDRLDLTKSAVGARIVLSGRFICQTA